MRVALLSDGVTAMYDGAFNGCSALEGISISPYTTDIGSKALNGCTNVTVCCLKNTVAAKTLTGSKIETLRGDVDGDGDFNIVDTTVIQCYVARKLALDGDQMANADINFDADIDINDATMIQMILAEIIDY